MAKKPVEAKQIDLEEKIEEVKAGEAGFENKEKDPALVGEKEPVVKEPVVDPSVALQKQIDDLKKSEATQKQRADNANREREEALRQARAREVEIAKFQNEARESNFDAINAALAAANAEAEKAQLDIENAAAIQDTKAQSEAYRRLARAEANIAKLEDGKAAAEAAKKEPVTVKTEVVSDPIEKSGLPDNAKAWLRNHPEYLQDQRKNAKIQALHWDIIDEGHAPFSVPYFESMETHLGMREAPKKAEEEVIEEVKPQQRTSIVSAPVSREAPAGGGGGSPRSVKLTQEQKEFARIAGVTETEYAKQLAKITEMKANGSYGERQ